VAATNHHKSLVVCRCPPSASEYRSLVGEWRMQ